ncbi:MAG: helix-turn-helix domain-containing protein [Rhodothermales bacterium]
MTHQLNPDDWLSQAEAAELRGVSRQAIFQLVQKGRFRTLEIGGRTLVHRDDVLNFEPDKGGRPTSEENQSDAASSGSV